MSLSGGWSELARPSRKWFSTYKMDPNKVLVLSIKVCQVIKEGYLYTNLPLYSQYELWNSMSLLINHHYSEDSVSLITFEADVADTLVQLFCSKHLELSGKSNAFKESNLSLKIFFKVFGKWVTFSFFPPFSRCQNTLFSPCW